MFKRAPLDQNQIWYKYFTESSSKNFNLYASFPEVQAKLHSFVVPTFKVSRSERNRADSLIRIFMLDSKINTQIDFFFISIANNPNILNQFDKLFPPISHLFFRYYIHPR